VSVGNLSKNDRCSIILMDYAGRRRLKLIGHIRVVEAAEIEASVLGMVGQADYTAVIERVFLIEMLAFDWNCPQYISRRYTEAEFEEKRLAQLAG
jgi:hypothetical protein